jgi:hypothetical protein
MESFHVKDYNKLAGLHITDPASAVSTAKDLLSKAMMERPLKEYTSSPIRSFFSKDHTKKLTSQYLLAAHYISSAVAFSHSDDFFWRLWLRETNGTQYSAARRAIAERVTQLAEAIIREEIRNIRTAPGVCITTDVWSNGAHDTGFLGLTVHYTCPQSFRVFASPISMVPIPGRHTGVRLALLIASELDSVLSTDQWLFSATTDMGANMRKSAQLLLLSLADMQNFVNNKPSIYDEISAVSELESFMDMQLQDASSESLGWAISCVDHAVKNAITDAVASIQSISTVIQQLSIIAKTIFNSEYLHRELTRIQQVLGLTPIRIKKHFKLRWTGLHLFLQNMVQLWDPITVMIKEGLFDKSAAASNIQMPPRTKLPVISGVVSILDAVLPIMQYAQGDQYSSQAWTVFIGKCFVHATAQPNLLSDDSPASVLDFKTMLCKNLDTRLGFLWAQDSVALISFMLHPQFGGHAFKFLGAELFGNIRERIVEWMVLLSTPPSYEMDEKEMGPELWAQTQKQDNDHPLAMTKELVQLLSYMRSPDVYPNLPCDVICEDGEIVSFGTFQCETSNTISAVAWAHRSSECLSKFYTSAKVIKMAPNVIPVAMMAASVQPSSAASERLFSVASLVDQNLRRRLSTENLSRCTVAKSILNAHVHRGDAEKFIRDTIHGLMKKESTE